MQRQIELIGAAWGLGGADPGCAEAPAVLIPLLAQRLAACGVTCAADRSSSRRRASGASNSRSAGCAASSRAVVAEARRARTAAVRDRRRPQLRRRHLDRRRAHAARQPRPGLDRRAHGQPHAGHQPHRAPARHAARVAARPGRRSALRPRLRRARAAPRLPGRRAQLRARGGRAPEAPRRARDFHGRGAPRAASTRCSTKRSTSSPRAPPASA